MNTQTITLTPPIDGVQYGISDEPIKEGDWYWDDLVSSWKGVSILCHAGVEYDNGDKPKIIQSTVGTTSPIRVSHKVILSTNPKDINFPYLVMPSKEHEVERLAENNLLKHYGTLQNAKKDADDYIYEKNLFIAGYNANKGIYTQEDMINVAKFATGTYRTEKQIKSYIQSLSPTAKAVRVEMIDNGYEVDMEGRGGMELGETCWLSKMEIKVETSSEHLQGIVKALEVIY